MYFNFWADFKQYSSILPVDFEQVNTDCVRRSFSKTLNKKVFSNLSGNSLESRIAKVEFFEFFRTAVYGILLRPASWNSTCIATQQNNWQVILDLTVSKFSENRTIQKLTDINR